MKTDRNELFRQIDPPAGGVERLRQRMEDSASGRSRRPWQPAMAAATLMLVIVISMRWSTAPRETTPSAAQDLFNAAEFDRLLGRPPATGELLVLRADQPVQLVELEGTRANIRVYRLNPG